MTSSPPKLVTKPVPAVVTTHIAPHSSSVSRDPQRSATQPPKTWKMA